MRLLWDEEAWEEYVYWQGQDKKTLKKINKILQDMARDPFHGIGKPEPLKGDLAHYWSRRIDSCNRIVYREKDGVLVISSCRGHYGD